MDTLSEYAEFGIVDVDDALVRRAGDLAHRLRLRGYDAVIVPLPHSSRSRTSSRPAATSTSLPPGGSWESPPTTRQRLTCPALIQLVLTSF